ncbi:DMT family transporter [Falsibacillus albus]|uniref:QacE family quaternary ammonium compound efflux SMR transporter n=1 Tax=Falsibacillus albus TaxID=2478915 RepID=A0A3L7K527_9BACI|nr:multidrug efflux SMR transporter [Falsibacillus albus]RLQ97364.1 QacE family quaternary ammonium compound efflux SMR transporter [Falsibacillus albus]
MAWIYLIIAGVFEVVWAMGLKLSNGFSKVYPSIVTVVGMLISLYFLSAAVKILPIGTAYAIWTGIGAAGAVIMGIILFDEPKTLARFIFLGLIIIGMIGLKAVSGEK